MKTMKLWLMVFCLSLAMTAVAKSAKATNAQRVAYVLKNVGVKSDVKARLQPVLEGYLKDKDAANAAYDKMKAKLKPRIKLGNLSDQQAQQLLDAKWAAEEKELQVKRSYEQKLKAVVPVKKVYECFRLLNDKNSKVLGDDE